MNPAILLLLKQILAGVQAAIGAAPQVVEIVVAAKAFITSLFNQGLISVEQQNACHSYVDNIAAMKAAGIILPHWSVEEDPVTPSATLTITPVK